MHVWQSLRQGNRQRSEIWERQGLWSDGLSCSAGLEPRLQRGMQLVTRLPVDKVCIISPDEKMADCSGKLGRFRERISTADPELCNCSRRPGNYKGANSPVGRVRAGRPTPVPKTARRLVGLPQSRRRAAIISVFLEISEAIVAKKWRLWYPVAKRQLPLTEVTKTRTLSAVPTSEYQGGKPLTERLSVRGRFDHGYRRQVG